VTKRRYLLIGFALFAFVVHLIGLNQAGRTWDEQFKVDLGYIAWNNIFRGEFSQEAWSAGTEHPMVAKYIYGFFLGPHLTFLKDSQREANLTPLEIEEIRNGNYIITQLQDTLYAVSYDLTFPRATSALFNTLAIVLTVLLARRVVSVFWSYIAGVFLLVTSRFVGMGQLITYESLSVFLFCLIALLFYRLLKNPDNIRLHSVIGILSGMMIWTRYNNVVVFLFLGGWFVIHILLTKQKNLINWKFLIIPFVAFFLGISIWPYVWHDFPTNLIDSFHQNQSRPIQPSFYYIEQLLVTTPIPIIIGGLVGIFLSIKGALRKEYWHVIFLWWLLCVGLFASFLAVEMGGTRYIFVIYPVIAIMATYGYFRILKGRLVWVIPLLVTFMLFDQARVFPYYIDYYNQFVGGPKGAVEQGYQFSWWGEGQRELGIWINQNLPSGSSIGLIVTPKYVFPQTRPDLVMKGYVDSKSDAQYIVVSWEDKKSLSKDFFDRHEVLYESLVDGKALVTLYKKK
jgi:hypothetical protein